MSLHRQLFTRLLNVCFGFIINVGKYFANQKGKNYEDPFEQNSLGLQKKTLFCKK